MQGYGVVREMEHVETKGETPAKEVLISDCGELDSDALTSTASVRLLPTMSLSCTPACHLALQPVMKPSSPSVQKSDKSWLFGTEATCRAWWSHAG